MPNINGRFADQNDIVLTGQVQTANNNQTTLNAILAETNQLRSTPVTFQSTGLLATPANPVPNATGAVQGTVGAALGGIGQADTPSVTPGGGGNPCFTALTPVLMADNKERPIIDINLGEWVKAFDNHGNLIDARVIGLHQHIAFETLKVTFEDGRVTHTTPLHPYWVIDEVFEPIFKLDKVWHWDDVWTPRKITNKEAIEGEMIVYNLEVDTYKTYVANGDGVHNLKPLPENTPEQS